MSKTDIKLEILYDKEHFLDFTKKVYDYKFKHSKKRYIGWLFIAIAQFGIVAALKHNAYGLLYISTFFLLYWYVVRWQVRKYLALKWFEKNPLKDKILHIHINDDSMVVDNKKVPWSDINTYQVLDDGVLIYYCNTASFFPKNSFSNIEDYNIFLELLKKNLNS